MSDRSIAIAGLVVGVLGIAIALGVWVIGGKRTEPAPPSVEVQWQERQGWRCYGGLALSVEPGDPYTLALTGSNDGALGVLREATVTPDKTHNVVLVEVMNRGASTFHGDRMLKVSIGDEDAVLLCESQADRFSEDSHFVSERDGYFSYIIPDTFFSQALRLMLTFWNADIENLRLRVGLTTEDAITIAARGEPIAVPARLDQRFFQLVATSAVISTIVQVAGLVVALAGFCAAVYFGQRMLRKSGQ